MLRYIALLLLIPLLDALFLVVLVPFLGWQLVVLLVVLTALIGLLLVRLESRHTLVKIQRKAARGEPPTNELIDGGLLIAAGAFLLTPGLITDLIGFLIVIPLTRYPIRWVLKKRVIVPFLDSKTGGMTSGNVYIGGFPNQDFDADVDGFGTGGVDSGGGPPPGGDSATGGNHVTESGDSSGESTETGFTEVRDVDYEEVDDDGREK